MCVACTIPSCNSLLLSGILDSFLKLILKSSHALTSGHQWSMTNGDKATHSNSNVCQVLLIIASVSLASYEFLGMQAKFSRGQCLSIQVSA